MTTDENPLSHNHLLLNAQSGLQIIMADISWQNFYAIHKGYTCTHQR